jgi:hypothetical protein
MVIKRALFNFINKFRLTEYRMPPHRKAVNRYLPFYSSMRSILTGLILLFLFSCGGSSVDNRQLKSNDTDTTKHTPMDSTKKGIKRASADVGLMFTAFNLRRLMNIIDKNAFKKFLQQLASLFSIQMTLLQVFSALKRLHICSLRFCKIEIKAAL